MFFRTFAYVYTGFNSCQWKLMVAKFAFKGETAAVEAFNFLCLCVSVFLFALSQDCKGFLA